MYGNDASGPNLLPPSLVLQRVASSSTSSPIAGRRSSCVNTILIASVLSTRGIVCVDCAVTHKHGARIWRCSPCSRRCPACRRAPTTRSCVPHAAACQSTVPVQSTVPIVRQHGRSSALSQPVCNDSQTSSGILSLPVRELLDRLPEVLPISSLMHHPKSIARRWARIVVSVMDQVRTLAEASNIPDAVACARSPAAHTHIARRISTAFRFPAQVDSSKNTFFDFLVFVNAFLSFSLISFASLIHLVFPCFSYFSLMVFAFL